MTNNKIVFIGTGEACDRERNNTSILIEQGNSATLLDCGFTSAQGYFKQKPDPVIKTIWLSHLHGDHFFGIPHLVLYFYQLQRKEPLTIISGFQCSETILSLIHSAYPGLLDKLNFQIHFSTISPGDAIHHDSMVLRCASSIHSQEAFSLQLQINDTSIYYSGDGSPSLQGEELLSRSHIVIHEAYSFTQANPSHCSIEKCFSLAKQYELPTMALVHLNNTTRQQQASERIDIPATLGTAILFPKDGDHIFF